MVSYKTKTMGVGRGSAMCVTVCAWLTRIYSMSICHTQLSHLTWRHTHMTHSAVDVSLGRCDNTTLCHTKIYVRLIISVFTPTLTQGHPLSGLCLTFQYKSVINTSQGWYKSRLLNKSQTLWLLLTFTTWLLWLLPTIPIFWRFYIVGVIISDKM